MSGYRSIGGLVEEVFETAKADFERVRCERVDAEAALADYKSELAEIVRASGVATTRLASALPAAHEALIDELGKLAGREKAYRESIIPAAEAAVAPAREKEERARWLCDQANVDRYTALVHRYAVELDEAAAASAVALSNFEKACALATSQPGAGPRVGNFLGDNLILMAIPHTFERIIRQIGGSYFQRTERGPIAPVIAAAFQLTAPEGTQDEADET